MNELQWLRWVECGPFHIHLSTDLSCILGGTGRETTISWVVEPAGQVSIMITFRTCSNSGISSPARTKWLYVILTTCENWADVWRCLSYKNHSNQFKSIPFRIEWAVWLSRCGKWLHTLSKVMKCLHTVLNISLKYLAGAEHLNPGCHATHINLLHKVIWRWSNIYFLWFSFELWLPYHCILAGLLTCYGAERPQGPVVQTCLL